jgi:hypothetical protein
LRIYQQISKEIMWRHEQAKKYLDKGRMEAPTLERGIEYIYEGELKGARKTISLRKKNRQNWIRSCLDHSGLKKYYHSITMNYGYLRK